MMKKRIALLIVVALAVSIFPVAALGVNNSQSVEISASECEPVVEEPRQTISGSFSSEDALVTQINWELENENTVSDTVSGTAVIDYDTNTWVAEDIILGSGENTITFSAVTVDGDAAKAKTTIEYDPGSVKEYKESEITYFVDEDGKELESGYVNNVVLVVLDASQPSDVRNEVLKTVVKESNGVLIGEIHGLEIYQIRIAKRSYEELQSLCRKLEKCSSVVISATPDLVFPEEMEEESADSDIDDWSLPIVESIYDNDPWEEATWDEENPEGANWWAEAVRAPSAWGYKDYFNTVNAGIMDGGAYQDHEDLSVTRVSTNYKLNSHGTHVAGLLGATHNNGIGIGGMGYSTDLYLADMYSNSYSGASYTRNAAAVNDLLARGCRVINNSNGLTKMNTGADIAKRDILSTVKNWEAIITNGVANYQDFLIFQSAGNGYGAESGDYVDAPYDAFYNGFFTGITSGEAKDHVVVTAAAMIKENNDENTARYQLTRWSNIGDNVDLASPGSHIYSTDYNDSGEKYSYKSGTSMAAPIAAGLASLIWAVNPDLTAKQVKQIMMDKSVECSRNEENTDPNTVRYDARESYPMINASEAVKEALRLTYSNGTAELLFVDNDTGESAGGIGFTVYKNSEKTDVVGRFTTNEEGKCRVVLPRAAEKDYHAITYYVSIEDSDVITGKDRFQVGVDSALETTIVLGTDPEEPEIPTDPEPTSTPTPTVTPTPTPTPTATPTPTPTPTSSSSSSGTSIFKSLSSLFSSFFSRLKSLFR